MLKHPAIPSFVEGTSSLDTPEWELAFTEGMRCKVQYEPVNAAICISHLRAIRQCMGASHRWCMIMEGDAKPTPFFATGILSALLALSGTPTQKCTVHDDPPAIIYFCMSEHAPKQLEKVIHARTMWRSSQHWTGPAQPSLKNLTPYFGARCYWVGQGARGYLMSPEFAQFVLSQPIGNPWDLHLIDLLERWQACAYLIYPSPLQNIIYPAKANRGSDRLRSYFGGEGEAVSDYILVLLDGGWGLWNRVRTIVWTALLANFHRLGLFVLWRVSNTCDMKFDEIFPEFSTTIKSICGGSQWYLPFLISSMAQVKI